MYKRLVLVSLLLILSQNIVFSAKNYTYIDLINQLTDMKSLSILPEQGDICAQYSSYDRASKYDESTDKYIDWDANGDHSGIIRIENGQEVLAEIEGPGCIQRIWSADAEAGHVRIYLDGSLEPAVDLPFSGYFDCNNSPFIYPALVHDASSGKNNYVPIPFQKSCKITADPGWGAYYHFTYRKFPKDTIVPTFTRNLLPEERAALADANTALSTGLGKKQYSASNIKNNFSGIIPAKGSTSVFSKTGKYAISALRVNIDPDILKTRPDILRELYIRIKWDNEKDWAVWSPLGDFFGTGPGINLYKSLPLGMTEDGFYSYWYMPFSKSGKIEIGNDSSKSVSISVSVDYEPLSQDISNLGRFHAKWHRDVFLNTIPERQIDWPMLKTTGRGRFCGVALMVYNPKGGWWGEGDEKFFVDNEKLPSTFGTGSEDYFGYAWCNPALFKNAYHNQTINKTGNTGIISVNRWHITDNIPFQQAFEGSIEKYFPNRQPTLYASTVYFYLAPGLSDNYKAVPLKDRIGWDDIRPKPPVPGLFEGEKMKVISCTGGKTQVQPLEPIFSNSSHLWWTEGKPGDKLTLEVPVERTANYSVQLQLTKSWDYANLQVYLDDVPTGGQIDLYNPTVIPADILDLGIHRLKAGKHSITLEIVGANENAKKSYMAGIDYVRIIKSK